MKKKFIQELLRSSQTVFSFKELLLKFKVDDPQELTAQLHYFIKNGDLYHLRRGLYAKDNNYNRLELACKIFTPSYISFDTVLRAAGIIFQYDSRLFVASYQSREITCDEQTYIFKTVKPTILTNSLGVQILDNYSIATPERAFLDTIYLHKDYYFDNLEPLNWNIIYDLLPMYDNKSMQERVEMYHNSFKKSFRS
jgi:hypothetical protein